MMPSRRLTRLLSLLVVLCFGGCTGDTPPPAVFSGWSVGDSDQGYPVIVHTIDGGITWSRQGDAATLQGITLEDVSAVDAMTAWAAGSTADGNGLLLRTTDGGGSWTKFTPATAVAMGLHGIRALSPTVVWAVGDNGIIIKTVNGGAEWVRQGSVVIPGGSRLLAVTAVDSDYAWVAGADPDGYPLAARTTDGATWVRDSSWKPEGYQCFLTDLHAVSRTVVYAAQRQLSLSYRSLDGGVTWEPRKPKDFGETRNVTAICGIDAVTSWAGRDTDGTLAEVLFDSNDSWRIYPLPEQQSASIIRGVTATGSGMAWVSGIIPTDGTGYLLRWSPLTGVWLASTPAITFPLRRISMAGAMR